MFIALSLEEQRRGRTPDLVYIAVAHITSVYMRGKGSRVMLTTGSHVDVGENVACVVELCRRAVADGTKRP